MTPIDPSIARRVPGFDAPFFLGGMAGYGDTPFRLLCRRLGCPFAVTESMHARVLTDGGLGRRKAHPEIAPASGRRLQADHPLAGQLIGAEAEAMAAAARELLALGYDVVDVNLACPSKKKRGAVAWGGQLLRDPERAIEILRAVREAVPPAIPCSVKMRRGTDDSPAAEQRFRTIFGAAGELGYDWVTVHCRTVEQRYVGPGHWPFLRRLVADHPRRWIFGSGDVWTAEDVDRMREQTGVQAVSVARGAVRRPWIFRELRDRERGQDWVEPTAPEIGQLLGELLEVSCDWHGEAEAGRRFRKLAFPLIEGHPRSSELRRTLAACERTDQLRALIRRAYGADTLTTSP